MILKTNVTPPSPIVKNEVTGFMFEESADVQSFIKSIDLFLKGRNTFESHAFYLMNQEYQELSKKELFPILMDCGKIDLNAEKNFKDGTLSCFENMIYENMEINEKFHQLQIAIDQLINSLEIKKSHYTIELQGETFDVKKLLRMLTVDLHNNSSHLNHLELRECFYDIISKMNKERKEVVVFIIFPESHIGTKDIDKFMNWLKKLKVTSIVISNNFNIFKKMKFNNINFVKKNHMIYDLVRLSNELELFEILDYENWNSQVIQLGYFDFTDNRILINQQYNDFLFK